MNRKIKVITCIIIAIIISTVAYGVYYLNDYYPSDESVNKYLNGTDNVTVIENSNYLFLNGTSDDTALIFYPKMNTPTSLGRG